MPADMAEATKLYWSVEDVCAAMTSSQLPLDAAMRLLDELEKLDKPSGDRIRVRIDPKPAPHPTPVTMGEEAP